MLLELLIYLVILPIILGMLLIKIDSYYLNKKDSKSIVRKDPIIKDCSWTRRDSLK